MVIRRGEIWWASLDEPRKSGPGYRRPVLIVQINEFNRSRLNTIIAAIITSNLKLARAPGNVFLPRNESPLPKDSVINVSQIVTIDKSFLTECIGEIAPLLMRRIETGLRLVMGL